MFPGAIMMGAQDRLLPPSVPFRFFATAIVFHVAGWAALLAGAGTMDGFMGGMGPGLAGLHLITLGVLAMTAMGAAFQMLPVAARRPLGPVWACRLTWWLYAPGVAVLAAGMAWVWPWALHLGGGLAVAGLVLFAILVARNLRDVNDLKAVTGHLWLALAALAGLALLGLGLIADLDLGFLGNRGGSGAAHAVLAGYGFMGSLAMGFSYVLIPMFVLGSPVPEADGRRTARLGAAALVLAAGGALTGLPLIAVLGGVAGLIAAGLHLRALMAVLAMRMRKRLESFFRLVWLAWIMLPASMIAGMALALGGMPEVMAPLWGWLLVFGWLLSFVTALLQRIMPFLASMHSGARGGKPVLLSKLVAERPLLIHAILHAVAVIAVAFGLLARSVPLLQAGAASGLAGAVAFAVFAGLVMRRLQTHEQAQGKPSC